MLKRSLILVFAAAMIAVPAMSQADDWLARRLTIRYPGQDAKKHHHHHEWRRHEDRRRDHRHEHHEGGGRRDRW